MGKVKLGDFSIRADVVTKDEIGDMSEVFNEMLDNVTSFNQWYKRCRFICK